jgi:signal transduction histidine kinase
MASTLAHELSQPITASQNYLQASAYMLRERITGLEDVLAMVERASAQTRKAGEIIQRMRDFMVSGKVQGEREDLCALVAAACAGIACAGIDETEIVQAVTPGTFVLADGVQIGQVLANIVVNAVQAMEGCAVRRVTIASQIEGPMVAVRIADTGPGLSQESLGRLFEPFYTTKPAGTGLGLALCRTIVEAHGGRIWAERGQPGTTIAFTLRMADGEA